MTDITTDEIAYGNDRRPRLVRRLVEPALALVAARPRLGDVPKPPSGDR